MAGHCPGQDGRQLSVSIHRCPNCGSEVEMFSDETRVKCPSCKEFVSKEQMPSCVQWCSQARECLGEARWKELMGSAGDGGTGDDDAGDEHEGDANG